MTEQTANALLEFAQTVTNHVKNLVIESSNPDAPVMSDFQRKKVLREIDNAFENLSASLTDEIYK